MSHQRRKRLLKLLAEHQATSVEQLVGWLNASPATVRRDLAWLAEHSMLERTRGGARILSSRHQDVPLASDTFQANFQCSTTRKRAIARYAASMCADGETIIINGGTTTFMMAEFLTNSHLKILTNSFLMAERLVSSSENEVVVPGGKVYREQNVILSPFDNDITQHHYAGKMFMGIYGISQLGLMEADPLLVQAETRLIGQAEQLVVLADSSKFARAAGLVLCSLERVSTMITDDGIPDRSAQLLERHGVHLIVTTPDDPVRRH